jgi:hypothetical protein
VLSDGTGFVTIDEFDTGIAERFENIPTMGGDLVLNVSLIHNWFEYNQVDDDDVLVFRTNWLWEQGNNQDVCDLTCTGGGDKNDPVCNVQLPGEERVMCKLGQNPRAHDLNDPSASFPTTWFHGFEGRRRLRMGYNKHQWGMHMASLPNQWENTNDFADIDVDDSGVAQFMCAGRIGSGIPFEDFWSFELGDPYAYPPKKECRQFSNRDVNLDSCTGETRSTGSSLPLRFFLDNVRGNAQNGARSVHLPPEAFYDNLHPDAYIAFDEVIGVDDVPEDLAVPLTNGAPGDRSPYLILDRFGVMPTVRDAYTVRIVRTKINVQPVITQASISIAGGEPPAEQSRMVTLEVCNEAVVDNAAFDVVFDCLGYAAVPEPFVTTEPLAVGACDDMITFMIDPIPGTSAEQALCQATAYNNVGRRTAFFEVVFTNSTFVTPPGGTVPPTSVIGPSSPTPAPNATTPPPTPTPTPDDGKVGGLEPRIAFFLYVVLPTLGVMAIILGLVSQMRTSSPAELRRAQEAAIDRAAPPTTLSTPAPMTAGRAERMTEQVERARVIQSLSRAHRSGPGLHQRMRSRGTAARPHYFF